MRVRNQALALTIAVFGLAAALFGCGGGRAADNTVALVNGEPITREEVARALAAYDLSGPDRAELIKGVLSDLIDQKLILQQAARQGLKVSPEELAAAEAGVIDEYTPEGFRDMLLKQALSRQEWRRELAKRLLVEKTLAAQNFAAADPDPAEVARLMAGRADGVDKIKLAQIACQDRESAEEAKRLLDSGRSFREVADRFSLMAGQPGEKTGFLPQDALPEELAKLVWELKVGQVSPVFQGPHGWHVFVLLERAKGGGLTRQEALTRIKNRLAAELQEAWLDKLDREAKIEIFADRLVGLFQTNAKEAK